MLTQSSVPSEVSPEPPGRGTDVHRALPAGAAEVGRDRVAPARLGTAGFGKSIFPGRPTEGGSAVAPPPPGRASSALCHPTPPRRGAEGRVGPPRCAGGWPAVRKVRRLVPGLCPRPPRRVKAKVSGPRRASFGGGAGADPGRAPGTRRAMDGLGRRLRASLRLKRGRGGQCGAGARGRRGGGRGSAARGAAPEPVRGPLGAQARRQVSRGGGAGAGDGARWRRGRRSEEWRGPWGGEGEAAGQRKPLWGPGATCPSSQEACGATAVCLRRPPGAPASAPPRPAAGLGRNSAPRRDHPQLRAAGPGRAWDRPGTDLLCCCFRVCQPDRARLPQLPTPSTTLLYPPPPPAPSQVRGQEVQG